MSGTQGEVRDPSAPAKAVAWRGSLRTHVGAIRQAGVRPMLLATALFAYLMMGGWVVNRVVGTLFGLG